jgi:predicted PurR-regulated permease PerM
MQAELTQDVLVPKALDVAIRVGLGLLLVLMCYQIMAPFIAPIVWGIIIAIGSHPVFRRLELYFAGRSGLAAFVFTLALLAVLIIPAVLLTGALLDGAKELSVDLADGTLTIPPPPESVAEWPLVGRQVSETWTLAAKNLEAALTRFEPQLKQLGGWLLGASAKLGLSLLMFVFSIIIAGIFLANWGTCRAAALTVAGRLLGRRGEELARLSHATIVSVTQGILGIALAQTLLAGLGFLAIGIPAAGFLAVVCLILAVVQIDILLILIPLSIYAFSFAGTGAAVVFLVWNIAVGLLNNVLKPILLGRGVDAPMAVVFIGAIGGMILSGIIGLFVGAVVLVLGFKLLMVWVQRDGDTEMAADEPA